MFSPGFRLFFGYTLAGLLAMFVYGVASGDGGCTTPAAGACCTITPGAGAGCCCTTAAGGACCCTTPAAGACCPITTGA